MKTQLKDNTITIEFEIGNIQEDIIDFLYLLEASSKSEMTEEDVYQLSEEIKSNWWNQNKKRKYLILFYQNKNFYN